MKNTVHRNLKLPRGLTPEEKKKMNVDITFQYIRRGEAGDSAPFGDEFIGTHFPITISCDADATVSDVLDKIAENYPGTGYIGSFLSGITFAQQEAPPGGGNAITN
jgi:hypothetical protein